MVLTCWVNGCTNRNDPAIKRGFFSIPTVRENEGDFTKNLTEERRRKWISNINRKDAPSKYSRVCSDHFVTGKPASMYDKSNPDWVPTLKLSQKETPKKSARKQQKLVSDKKRFERVSKRQQTREVHHVARALIELQESTREPELTTSVPDSESLISVSEPKQLCTFVWKSSTYKTDCKVSGSAVDGKTTPSVTQSQIDSELQRLLTENIRLKSELEDSNLTQESFALNDDKVKYYTGLPNYLTFMLVLDIIIMFLPRKTNAKLGPFERLLMTLMRLKLNLPLRDLAYRFRISTATASRTFLTVIHIMYIRLKHLIYWPEREELRLTMPLEFRQHFAKKTSVIIDCFEIFIQRPKSLMARAQTWSQYKHHNTVKYLIGITPQGSISFISCGWGGRSSDKCITESCGILDKLLPGDLVLADRGFDIADSVGVYCAQVNIPSFTRGKSQLSATDVETTRKIAHVRIHVERVIGLVRNKYTILQGKLPIDFLHHEKGEIPTIDKIVTVCCALVNMNESVVGFN